MTTLDIKNPFGAPVYHEETLSSTFDAARHLAKNKENHGTVITADFQESGRGRLKRSWASGRRENLLFTILLRYTDYSSLPAAITLRTGLAVSLAIEELFPLLKGQVFVKWPNDIIIDKRKAVGILTETDGKTVYIGIGINVSQTEFPVEIRSKAVSIKQALPEGKFIDGNTRFSLLEKVLISLHAEIDVPTKAWQERLLKRLYKKGETVVFAIGGSEGSADSVSLVKGILSGIGPAGELLIIHNGEKQERAFTSGELQAY